MESTKRDDHYLCRLRAFFCDKYGVLASSISPAKRGYYGETWRLDSPDGRFFLKLDYSPFHQNKYRNSLEVVQYLCDSGIDFISKPIKTKTGELYSRFDSAILGVFAWIEGENIETDETKIPEYQMLGQIYPLTKPGFDIPSLAFSDDRAKTFFSKWERLKADPKNADDLAVLSLLERHRETLERYAVRLTHFSARCKEDIPLFYLTHGDAGGNLLYGNGKYSIVDWDEVMYAPLERDAWVMCCREWALKAFEEALKRNGIDYRLKPERLAFYCYHMYFLYLGEFLDDVTLYGKRQEIEGFFDGWILDRMKYADSIQ